MPTFGVSTATTNFSNTVRTNIQKATIATLRAGLVGLPKGSVVPADIAASRGDNFTLRVTEYPDLVDAAVTNPLTEGVPPAYTVLGVSTLDYTVGQVGAVTAVTDVAQFQSPHDLDKVAPDKISRLAAQVIDNLALTAIRAHTVDKEYLTTVLSTSALLDIKGELAARNIQPIPGVGYYALIHPYALRGLEGEAALNGYIDVQAQADAGRLSKGVVSQYRGISFVSSSRIVGALSAAARTGPTGAFATDIFTLAAHGMSNGQRIQFSSITGGTGFATATDYFLVSTTTNTFKLAATKGGAAIDLTASDITASTFKSEQYPVYFLGANSIAFGDVSTMDYFHTGGADSGNPLAQYKTWGFKGILGGKVISMAETVTGGTNDAATDRVMTITVASGETL